VIAIERIGSGARPRVTRRVTFRNSVAVQVPPHVAIVVEGGRPRAAGAGGEEGRADDDAEEEDVGDAGISAGVARDFGFASCSSSTATTTTSR
jgi:hypothetical protein